jgi:lactoylglutathione lyase
MDLDRSIAFYEAVGYEVVGRVAQTPLGELAMLKLPDDEFVTIELVYDPGDDAPRTGTTLSHFVIAVKSMDATLNALSARGLDVEVPTSPVGSADFLTTNVVDPDGHQLELVQWPAGHAAGMSAADFTD